MGLFDFFTQEEAENSYQNVYYQQQHHEGSLTHEGEYREYFLWPVPLCELRIVGSHCWRGGIRRDESI